MADFQELIDQLTRLGVNDPLLSGSTFDQAKEEYRRAFELDLVKKGRVMLQQYDFLRKKTEEMQAEMAELKTQLNELDQQLGHTLVLDGGQKLEFDGEGGEVFKKFVQERDEVLGGGLVIAPARRSSESEVGSQSNQSQKESDGQDLGDREDLEDRKEEEKSTVIASTSPSLSTGFASQSRDEQGEGGALKEQVEELNVDLGEIDLNDIDLGQGDGLQSPATELGAGGDMEPPVENQKLYDEKELEQESDTLLDFL